MRIGFLAWNQFQVAHAAEVARTFVGAEFIFIDRDLAGLKGFNPSWLVPYGAYSRFVSELDLQSLDGEYDAIVAQFRPPMKKPWRKTKLIIQQYSLAKPKTAYNSRWFSADHGLVYGAYSADIIGKMCPVTEVGNPRFDPVLEGRLDNDVIDEITAKLDPGKPTIVYQPTWGDLSTGTDFSRALAELADDFNVVAKPHHMTTIKSAGVEIPGIIDLSCVQVLDLGLYLNHVADIVVSDMSGAIFDALYCGKRVVLVGDDGLELERHKKADPTALEVSQRHRIGPYVADPDGLRRAVMEMLDRPGLYRIENERVVEECFAQRGGCAAIAAKAIRDAVTDDSRPEDAPVLRRYAAPDFNSSLAARAYSSAEKRRKKRPAGEVHDRRSGGRRKGTSFVRNRSFFASGSQLEAWRFESRKNMAGSIYQAFNANSAVRFSPVTWKGALSRVFGGNHSPDNASSRELLQKLGMFRTVAAGYVADGQPVPDELTVSINTLGLLADFFEVAARNELAPAESQRFIGADGLIRHLEEGGGDQIVELFLSLSMARELKDEGLRPYRSSQVKFAQNVFERLLHLGIGVYPRLQGGVSGVAPLEVHGRRVSFTWHTVDQGIPGHLHLKLGTLFGYFIIDDKGYSGWGSPAKMNLASITEKIDVGLADQHWRILHANLVEGGRSKYSQTDDDAPDFGDYIFFPMQVFDDTVARLADIDTHSLLNALIEWGKTSNLKVVVKRHPMCKSSAIAATLAEGEASGAIVLSNANIHRLIADAQCVVTVNSGVGAESLLHLKPVVTSGGSDYAPATTRVHTVAQLLEVLNARRWRSASDEEIKQFLYFYTKHYMVECEDHEAMSLRLRQLVSAAGVSLPAEPAGSGTMRIAADDADIELVEPAMSPGEKRLLKRRRLHAKNVRRMLARLGRRGLRYWLDGPTLSEFLRIGKIGERAATVHIGVLAFDHSNLSGALHGCARSLGLRLQERSLDGVPYGATMTRAAATSRWSGPHIAIRYYYEVEGEAWSPQSISLLAKGAEYAKASYRQAVRQIPAPLGAKLAFALSRPSVAASILLDATGMNRLIRRFQKKRPLSPVGRMIGRVFDRHLEIRVPMRFLHQASSIDSEDVFRTPMLPEEYLLDRYEGGAASGKVLGASALVGDGFCRISGASQMAAMLRRIRDELDRIRRLRESSLADQFDRDARSVAPSSLDRGPPV